MLPTIKTDVAIIGAGASGLAAAKALIEAGISVCILEGRSRIGGRIHTVHDNTLTMPIELGAEFIHGASRDIWSIVEAAGLSVYDCMDNHLHRMNGKLQAVPEFWEKVGNFLDSLGQSNDQSSNGPERTYAEFEEENRTDADSETLRLARAYVEGFHAADTKIISEKGLAVAEQAHEQLNGSETFRIQDGYDQIPKFLVSSLREPDRNLRLNTVVKNIRWGKGQVEIHCENANGYVLPRIACKRVLVTVPIGVLKAQPGTRAAIKFEPDLEDKRKSFESIHMGSALRIVLHFRTRFWEKSLDEPLAFLHAEKEGPFRVWWTPMPVRAPILTAWAGGPKAQELYQLSEAQILNLALDNLASAFDHTNEFMQSQIRASYFHNWQEDPFTLGAYSYLGIGGIEAAKEYAKPVENTLFFAGEATNPGAGRGTVDGAMATGYRAAEEIIESLEE